MVPYAALNGDKIEKSPELLKTSLLTRSGKE